MASDNKIIELIKQGDIAAFNTLFKSVYLQLYIHCRKFIPDPEDAKDILRIYNHRTTKTNQKYPSVNL